MSPVHQVTGEADVPASAVWPALRDRAETLTIERPDDPAHVGEVMYQIELMLSEIADLLLTVNNDRYDAEREHSRARSIALETHAATHQVTVARVMADRDALPQKQAWDMQRALFHHIEDVQKALQTKHYGLMNINKNMQSVMFERGRR